MINTVCPEIMVKPGEFIKNTILPVVFNYDCVVSKSLTLNSIKDLSIYLNRSFKNIYLGTSASGLDEYLTIIQ
jgi:hypothetical protein